jgi:aminoglycoside/choline kinase family phosphotransferase
MIDGDHVAMVDHQGARIGSIFYDLASITFDPYLELPAKRIRELFGLYCSNHPINDDGEAAWRDFLDAAAQRVMQANGAYGFLTQVKGIKSFERWREPGWRQLNLLLDWHAEAWGADVLSKPIRGR